MVKNNKKTRNSSKNKKKIESLLSDPKSLKKAQSIIESLDRNSRKELRTLLKSSARNNLDKEISSIDIKRLLGILDKLEEKKSLLKEDELRPAPWSKTVTLFDVYVTDEENFVPYVSPLATVGTIETSSSTNTGDEGTDTASQIEETIGTTDNGSEEDSDSDGGILGMIGL